MGWAPRQKPGTMATPRARSYAAPLTPHVFVTPSNEFAGWHNYFAPDLYAGTQQ